MYGLQTEQKGKHGPQDMSEVEAHNWRLGKVPDNTLKLGH